MIIDAHCHIDQFENPHFLLEKLKDQVIKIISVTNLPSHFSEGLSFYKGIKSLHPALGFHPLMVNPDYVDIQEEIQLFKDLILKTDFVGEIGLDGSVSKELFNEQLKVFNTLTKVASFFDKIISVHSRGAEKDVLSILKTNKVKYVVFHWFTGSKTNAIDAIDQGYYFSINRKMIRTKKGKELVSSLEPKQVLVESDAPFTTKCSSSYPFSDIRDVYIFLSTQWKVPISEVENRVNINFETLINKRTSKQVA